MVKCERRVRRFPSRIGERFICNIVRVYATNFLDHIT